MLEAVVRFRDAAGVHWLITSWVRYQPRAEHPSETARSSTGDAMLDGAAGAVIPGFGVAEEHAR